LERHEEALTAFDHALAIDPDNRDAWELKGLALDHALAIDPSSEVASEVARDIRVFPEKPIGLSK